MAGHALYGMAPCFGHTGVTFDAETDRPGPGSLRGHLRPPEAIFSCLSRMVGHALYGMVPCFGHTGVTFDVEIDMPGPSSLQVILRPPNAIFVFVRNGRPCIVWNGSLLWAYRGNF